MTIRYKINYLNQKNFIFNVSLLAIKSLYKEVSLSYKPGLVSFIDTGSHKDMSGETFLRSMFSLRNYFKKITLAGINNQDFKYLQILGLEAEKRMFKATKGINTHKGAIFSFGIICAAVGLLYSKNLSINAKNISIIISERWSKDILSNNNSNLTNGLLVKKKYGYQGARYEAANGFPTVINSALVHFKKYMHVLNNENICLMQTLFIIMKNLDDTNILHRGGTEGLKFVKDTSIEFLKNKGVFQLNWLTKVQNIHKQFILRNLSPGGSADLLALCYFVYKLEKEEL